MKTNCWYSMSMEDWGRLWRPSLALRGFHRESAYQPGLTWETYSVLKIIIFLKTGSHRVALAGLNSLCRSPAVVKGMRHSTHGIDRSWWGVSVFVYFDLEYSLMVLLGWTGMHPPFLLAFLLPSDSSSVSMAITPSVSAAIIHLMIKSLNCLTLVPLKGSAWFSYHFYYICLSGKKNKLACVKLLLLIALGGSQGWGTYTPIRGTGCQQKWEQAGIWVLIQRTQATSFHFVKINMNSCSLLAATESWVYLEGELGMK